MPVTPTSTALETIIDALMADTSLTAGTTTTDFNAGIAAARQLNDVLGQAIEHFGFNADKLITPAEMMAISDYVRATPLLHYFFLMGHGNDEGSVETGFHKLQNDGGNLLFQGRNMVDTVIDAIYHYGEEYSGGHFVNEDGNQNEEVADVAGWLNYFLNGRTVVFGTESDDTLGSGDFSAAIAAAANEVFKAGGGDDMIWAHTGHDSIYCGTGNDMAGGGLGNDQIFGEIGNDKLWGDEGDDDISGGGGFDTIGGGDGNDTISGDGGNDDLWGDIGNDLIDGGIGNDSIGGGDGLNTLNGGEGNDDIGGGVDRDLIDGGAGNDDIYGAEGHDRILGGDGNDDLSGGSDRDLIVGGLGDDQLSGGEGADVLRGCGGADYYHLWDADDAQDTIKFMVGDAGRSLTTIDVVEGFTSGEDKIDLRSFGPMTFETLDYIGGGAASCYYDGRYLRIDHDGDRASDMIIEMKWLGSLEAQDFIFA